MKLESKLEYFGALYGDLKKMTDAELETSLKELRELTLIICDQIKKPQSAFRRSVA